MDPIVKVLEANDKIKALAAVLPDVQDPCPVTWLWGWCSGRGKHGAAEKFGMFSCPDCSRRFAKARMPRHKCSQTLHQATCRCEGKEWVPKKMVDAAVALMRQPEFHGLIPAEPGFDAFFGSVGSLKVSGGYNTDPFVAVVDAGYDCWIGDAATVEHEGERDE